jgi:hypothetical protein
VVYTLYQCRLVVLAVMERGAFALCPDVPAIWLPWVLQEHGYVMRPLTVFVADVAVYCLGAPIIEEVIKVSYATSFYF